MEWWEILLIVVFGFPVTLYIVYVFTRIITTAISKSYFEEKERSIKKWLESRQKNEEKH